MYVRSVSVVDDFQLERTFGFADELRNVHVAIEPKDREAFENREIERYRWFMRATLQLASGEVRRAWGSGSWEDDDLAENLPNLSFCAPADDVPARSVIHVEGELEIDGELVVFDQRIDDNWSELEPTTLPLPEWPVSTRTAVPVTRSIAVPDGARLVATLPEIGLVEYVRPTYRLHTPSGSLALAGLDSVVDGLPGRERRRTHAGGARGRLAIYSAREDPSGEHVVLVEVFRNGAVRVIHRSASIANELGCFDPSGTLYLGWSLPTVTQIDRNTTSIGRSSVVFDTDAVQLVPDWTGPLGGDGSRYHVDSERIAVLRYGRLSLAERGQPATATMQFTGAHDRANAHHPVPGVSAWLAGDALHLFHPQRGAQQMAVDGDAVAVLRDGRVVVVGDHLFVVDFDAAILDLGPVGYCGSRLEITEAETTTLWTLDPERWSIAIP